jgi:hypothetical protein
MATFQVNADLLKTLCKVNQFELPHDGMLFFGVRGAITGLPNDQSFKKDQLLQLIDLNYLNPRCYHLPMEAGSGRISSISGKYCSEQRGYQSLSTPQWLR